MNNKFDIGDNLADILFLLAIFVLLGVIGC